MNSKRKDELKFTTFHDGYIHAKLPLKYDIDNIKDFFDEYTEVINKTSSARVIYDASHITNIPGKKVLSYIQDRMGDIRKSVPQDRDAIVIGNHPLVKITFQSILSLTGFSNMKFFKNVDEAIDWITS